MAMSMGPGRGKRKALAEINVTPMVDVMLVLLIIFMITAPALKEGFQVELPRAASTQSIMVQEARRVTIAADGAVLRHEATSAAEKYERLSQLVDDLKGYREECEARNAAPVVVINGDRHVPYERFIQVWDAVRSAGVAEVAFQVDPGAPADN